MRTHLGMLNIMIAAVGLNFGMVGCAQNASEKGANSLPMAEQTKVESVTGRVNDMYIDVKVETGEIRHLKVDEQTNMDKVAIGDHVLVVVTDDSHASIIQRKGRMPLVGGNSMSGTGFP